MYSNSKNLMSTLTISLLFASFMSHPANKVYAVIDLPPYGCEPFGEVECINTEITKIIVNAIDGDTGSIRAFPYPRALHMFESGRSTILVALMNKQLMKRSHVFELFSGIFYVVAVENKTSSGSSTISYLKGADAQKEIASSIDATAIEVNNYQQIVMMLKANRLDYAIIPRLVYESELKGVLENVTILSEHRLPVMLYVNKSESQHIDKIRAAVSTLSLHKSNQYKYIFP